MEYLFFNLCVLLLVHCCQCQTCPSPDYPTGGNYLPKSGKFQPGDTINYSCDQNYTIVGKETSKCTWNGDWSNPTPFCERKVDLKNPYVATNSGTRLHNPEILDRNQSSCYAFKSGEKQMVDLEKEKEIFAVRLFFGSGETNINIYLGKNHICKENYFKNFERPQWDMIICKDTNEPVNTVTIQDKSPSNNNSPICEMEVYAKEDDGCEKPPDRKISNGYFAVSRSIAWLICEEGYKSTSDRLVCEGNKWKGGTLQCEEILCNPLLNLTLATGTEWIFLDPVKKISAGTRRELRCNSGYRQVGWPKIIICQKNGTWTKTNAYCVEEDGKEARNQTIIFSVVGLVVILIIIILLGTTIYFVRKQRNRQVVVVYKSPTEGSVISGSEGEYSSAYYESIQAIQPPLPPASSRPTPMLTDGYILPLDRKDSLKKISMPADIAFDTLKQSTLYGY